MTAPPNLPSFDGFDSAGALRRLHGRGDQLLRLLRAFAAQHRDTAAALDAQLARGEDAAVGAALHALKGSAATLGLATVAHDASEREHALAQGTRPWTCGALATSLDAAITAIEAFAEPAASEGQSLLTFDPAGSAQLLDELRRYVHEQELIPDTLLDELQRAATMSDLTGRVAALFQHIVDFDHAAALADIDAIQGR